MKDIIDSIYCRLRMYLSEIQIIISEEKDWFLTYVFVNGFSPKCASVDIRDYYHLLSNFSAKLCHPKQSIKSLQGLQQFGNKILSSIIINRQTSKSLQGLQRFENGIPVAYLCRKQNAMMTFKKYSSIENHFDSAFMEKVRNHTLEGTSFVVQEKVHGSNCSFLCDGQDIQFAKRTAVVDGNEDFYQWQELAARYREQIFKVFGILKEHIPEITSIIVYGEMFGGAYPHKDVKRIGAMSAIQKGVYYCPGHDFYGFDIFVYTPESNFYLDVDTANQVFAETGIFYAETLFEGTIDECLAYPNAFPSKIFKHFGLPEIADNICEGIVIRPKEPLYIPNGSRIIIKSKNARFAEKKGNRHVPKQPRIIADEVSALFTLAEDYFTEPRLDNVKSHIGEVSFPRDLGRVSGLLAKDVLEDFLKEHSEDYNNLAKQEQKTLNGLLSKRAIDFIKGIIGMP